MNPLLKSASISRILMLFNVIIIALFVLSTCISIIGVNRNAAMTAEFYQRPYQVSKSALSLRNSVEEASSYLNRYISMEEGSTKTQTLDHIDQLFSERTAEFEVISSSFTANMDVLKQFTSANESLVAFRNDILDACESGDEERARELYEQDYLPLKTVTVELADEIIRIADQKAIDFVKESNNVATQTAVSIGLIGLVVVAAVIALWRVMWSRITRAIALPVNEIEQVAKRVSEGDLTARVSYTSDNELGSLASSINNTVFTLHTTMERLSETAEQVAYSSSQVSDSSQAIAQGSSEQAMAIEELAANAQSITQVAKKNTESVLVTNENTTDVLSTVEHSNDQISKTVEIIRDIKASTRNISQLANDIEDISFQTNILALNASVEAARAGDAGRGFAIVAEEIRRLATQVGEASRAADELAVRATASVENGSMLIEVTSENMEGVVAATEGIKETMSAITQASVQQLEAVSQIQEGLDELSDVVQENSAASEESAVTGEELAEQARNLKKLIDHFTLEQSEPDASADGGAAR